MAGFSSCRIRTELLWEPEAIVLGKGPSAASRGPVLLRYPKAILVTLNHAIRWADGRKHVWAHFVDIEAFEDSRAHVEKFATRVVHPSVMNEGGHRSKRSIRPTTSRARVVYDRDEVGVRFFSAEGALGVLGTLGYKRVLLCGVDGGTGYAPGLEDVAHRHLDNGRRSFDVQWEQLETIAAKYGMEVRRALVSEGTQRPAEENR